MRGEKEFTRLATEFQQRAQVGTPHLHFVQCTNLNLDTRNASVCRGPPSVHLIELEEPKVSSGEAFADVNSYANAISKDHPQKIASPSDSTDACLNSSEHFLQSSMKIYHFNLDVASLPFAMLVITGSITLSLPSAPFNATKPT